MPQNRSTTIDDAQVLDFDISSGGLPATAPAFIARHEPITYRGERVLTTELAAEAFGVDAGRIANNFDRNRARFEEGKHFFRVSGSALRDMKDQPSSRGLVSPHAAHLILWTERGIARHAKMLETDTAWAIFETLEDTYFRVRDERAAQAPAIPDFTSPAEAARAWAEQYEARVLAERKKAEIGSRREATAMGTASAAVRHARKLEVELDRSRQFATVKRMSMIHHGQRFEWRKLRAASVSLGIPPIDIYDANYGTVKAYHFAVWLAAYALEIPGQDGETGDAE